VGSRRQNVPGGGSVRRGNGGGVNSSRKWQYSGMAECRQAEVLPLRNPGKRQQQKAVHPATVHPVKPEVQA